MQFCFLGVNQAKVKNSKNKKKLKVHWAHADFQNLVFSEHSAQHCLHDIYVVLGTVRTLSLRALECPEEFMWVQVLQCWKIKPRALCFLSKQSVTELHPQPIYCFIKVGKAADVGIHGDYWNRFLADSKGCLELLCHRPCWILNTARSRSLSSFEPYLDSIR